MPLGDCKWDLVSAVFLRRDCPCYCCFRHKIKCLQRIYFLQTVLMILLIRPAILLALLTAVNSRAAAQSYGSSEGAVSVTVTAAEPDQRPVPDAGFGVSYTGVRSRARHESPERGCRADNSLAFSFAAPRVATYAGDAFAGQALTEGIQLRNPLGQRFASHIVRPVRARSSAPVSVSNAARRQVVIALE